MDEFKLRVSNISAYKCALWDGDNRIIDNYATIRNYLSTKDGCVCDFFSRPIYESMGMDEKVSWHSSVFGDVKPVQLSVLDGNEKLKYRAIYEEVVDKIRSIVVKENSNIKSMIESAMKYKADEANIYCGNDHVCVVEWGMWPGSTSPIDIFGQNVKGEPSRIDLIRGGKPISDTQHDSIDVHETKSEMASEHLSHTEPKSEPEPKLDSESDSDPELASDPDSEPRLDSDLDSDSKLDPNPDSDSRLDPNPDSDGHKCAFLMWLRSKKRWWFLIVLILLILLLAKNCNRDSYIPPQEGVMEPIDEVDIQPSPDSTHTIVADRLVVIISGGGTVEDFMKEFKKVYPGKDYRITYYNHNIPRVQIQFPKEEKLQIENELPGRMPRFELIIYDESIFTHNYKAKDPGFSDNRKSWYFDMIKCYGAWDVTKGDKSIVVAVVDDGFDMNHSELSGKIVKPYNAVTNNSDVTPSASGHGTHVAGTAVGNMDNGQGVCGIAPNCTLMPVQVANSNGVMTTTAVIDGVLYAISNGADVINMSLGMQINPLVSLMPLMLQRQMIYNNFLEEESVWTQIFAMAEKNNCAIVLAAGNDNVLAGIDPMQRSPYGIKVSAVQSDQTKAWFSNYGEFSTISAPGVSIYSSIPGNDYDYMDGTSMASPIVAGAVALMKSEDKTLTTAQIVNVLNSTGLRSPSMVGKIIQLDKALGVVDNGAPDANLPAKPSPDPNKPVSPIGNFKDCDEVNRKIRQLEEEIDRIKKAYPECVVSQDTMKLPPKLSLDKIKGRWKSTSSLHNTSTGEEVCLYFFFDGTSKGELQLVEENGKKFKASLTLSVDNDVLYIRQDSGAVASDGDSYSPYDFTFKPNSARDAVGEGKNRTNPANQLRFNLVSY